MRYFLFMIKPDRGKTGIDVYVGIPLCSAWSTGWARVLDIARTDDLLVPLHRYLGQPTAGVLPYVPFRPGPRFNRSIVVPLRRPTADTGKLVWAAAVGMQSIYEPGYKMAKAGVMLLDLVAGSMLQGELDLEQEDHSERTRLMVALDTLNQRYGKGTVHSGATGGTNKGKDWGMKQERRTPQYTTRWEDVPVARARAE